VNLIMQSRKAEQQKIGKPAMDECTTTLPYNVARTLTYLTNQRKEWTTLSTAAKACPSPIVTSNQPLSRSINASKEAKSSGTAPPTPSCTLVLITSVPRKNSSPGSGPKDWLQSLALAAAPGPHKLTNHDLHPKRTE
jgi:hypothetical protein